MCQLLLAFKCNGFDYTAAREELRSFDVCHEYGQLPPAMTTLHQEKNLEASMSAVSTVTVTGNTSSSVVAVGPSVCI